MRVCVFVETFAIFTYICAGWQLSNNLIPHLSKRQPPSDSLKTLENLKYSLKTNYKMRKIYLFVFLILLSLASNGQNPTEILQNSYLKCQSIQNGYYEMTKYKKYMTEKDTVKTSFNCYFKKLKNDSLYSSAFHYKHFFNSKFQEVGK